MGAFLPRKGQRPGSSLERGTRGALDARSTGRLATDERPPRRRVPGRARGRQALPPRRRGRRHDAAGQAPLEARSRRDRRARGTAARRRRRRLGDERQDHDDRDGRRDPRAGPQARLEPLRREPRLRRRLHPPRRARRRPGAARGRRRCAAGGRSPRQAARGAARQPLPRPARPLRRARAHRRALAHGDGRPAAGDRARRQRRRPAGRRPGARPRRTRSPTGSTTRATPARRSSTRPTRATASAAGSRTSSRPRTSAISATTAAPPAATRGRRSMCARREIELDGLQARLVPARDARGRRPGSGCRCPASTTSTTRSARPRSPSRSARRSRRSATGSSGSAPPSAASSGSRPATRRLLMLLIKNPAGANEVVHTLLEGGAPSLLLVALNDAIADGKDVSWIWDVDFEPLLGRDGAADRLRRPGRGAGLRCVYGGLPRHALEVEPDLGARARPGPRADRPGGELVVLPTYTAMLELQRIVAERGWSKPYWERNVRIRVGHLYPDYLNIYADRGNIAVLDAAGGAPRPRARRGGDLHRRRGRPRRARPLLHRRRPGPRAGADRTRPRREGPGDRARRSRTAPRCSRSAAATSCSAAATSAATATRCRGSASSRTRPSPGRGG